MAALRVLVVYTCSCWKRRPSSSKTLVMPLSALKKDRMASRPTASGLVKLIGRNYDSTRIVA